MRSIVLGVGLLLLGVGLSLVLGVARNAGDGSLDGPSCRVNVGLEGGGLLAVLVVRHDDGCGA